MLAGRIHSEGLLTLSALTLNQMKKALVFTIIILLLSIPISGCLNSSIIGFIESDLVVPEIRYVQNEPPALPTPLSGSTPTYSYILDWAISEVFVDYGGVMDLWINNTGPRDIFVYGYGLKWINTTSVYSRDSEAYVHPDERVALGLLAFQGPLLAEPTLYSINLKIAVRTTSGTSWHDYGAVTAADRIVDVSELVRWHNHTIEKNLKEYYNKVNSRINLTAVNGIVGMIRSEFPGTYNILQIAQAFEWVYSNIEYETDAGIDYWQSTDETLARRTGDCEDQAILLASIINALGGNARVNIINEHAFPTVFVLKNGIESSNISHELGSIRSSLSSYYGTALNVCFLNDSMGYWLVVDTTGSPYAGGLPTLSSPSDQTSNPGISFDWSFIDTDWLITVDVTGEVSTGGEIF